MNTLRRGLGLTGLSLLLVCNLGCNKMLANYSISRAKNRIAAAEKHEAKRFTPDLLEQTNTALNKALIQYTSQQFREARDSAKEASRLSQDLLERTIFLRAGDLRNETSKWLDRAKINQAQQENNEFYTKIKLDNETGFKLMDKHKYEKAIAIFDKVVSDVKALLNNLETKARAGLKETEQMKVELVKEGALENAPEYVDALAQFIKQIDTLITKDYNYRAALDERNKARQKKQEGIQETKRVKSDKQLREIENLLEVATNLGAEEFTLQNFRVIAKEYENLLTRFYEKNYDTVLTAGPELKPKVEKLIVETKRESARDKMAAVENAINSLVDGKARNYLPGRVEQLESLLKEARQLFERAPYQEDQYTDSKHVSLRALEMNKTIIEEFSTLAQQEINKAKEALSTGEGVFKTMKDIFSKPVPGQLASEDQSLEDSKQALKKELEAKLTNAQLSLGLAQLKREEKDFDTAIETAKQVAASAEEVRRQTYRVVAHNAILEIANELTRIERQGGRQYAAAETDKTLKLLEESKGLLHGGQFRDAVRRAADTKAQLEVLNQELERVAAKKIDQAQKALAQAKQDRAEQYQSDTFNQALVSLSRAKASLEGEGLQEAIESARQAATLAENASERSLRQWSEEEIRHADLLLAKSREAGASSYAPEQLQKATDLRKNLQQLYEQRSFKEAISVGEQAVEAATAALYAKVIEAENNIATARRYAGWEQEPERLAQAIVSAKNARELTDKGQYQIGLQHAMGAIVSAKNVARDAKRKAFEVRMATLEKHLQTAQREGAGYYQVKDVSKIMSEMNRLRNEFRDRNYEDLTQKIETLESQLAGVLEMTPDVIKDLVVTMQNRMAELEKRGAKRFGPEKIEELERKIKYAQLDFKAEKFRPSYQNARDASKLLDEVELNLDERDFDAGLNAQLVAFSDQLRKFGPVLDMGSPAMVQLAVDAQGRARAVAVMDAYSPSDLHSAINEIGARVQMLKPPPSREEIHAAAIRMLIVANTAAANFEKMLILDQYKTGQAKEIILTAYLQMYQARGEQQEIQRSLQYPQAKTEPRGVERVVSYQGY